MYISFYYSSYRGDIINISKMIGNTQLVRLKEFEQINDIKANIYAKIECTNMFGSIKDRVALKTIEKAEQNHMLNYNSCIIEATSGNMGIALAGICQIKHYSCKIIMPDNMSEVRKNLIKQYGAELILTPANLGMQGSIKLAKELQLKSTNIYYVDQFNNLNCVQTHKIYTAPEINKQLNGCVDVIISGIGTGATIIGLAKYFKIINSHIEFIGVLPSSFPHGIQGIGAGFDPPFIKPGTIDRIIYVETHEATEEKENIYQNEGLCVGLSSGAVISGLKKLLKIKQYKNKNIVLIFADGSDRY